MKESGYYPPGAEYDRRAPYNQCTEDVMAVGDVDVTFAHECHSEEEAKKLHAELMSELKKKPDVLDMSHRECIDGKWGNAYGLLWEYEEDEEQVAVYGDVSFLVAATVGFNYVDRKTAPEADDEEIRIAAEEQYQDTLSVDGWTVEQN